MTTIIKENQGGFTMDVQSIRFKRKRDSEWEKGLQISAWDDCTRSTNTFIVDMKALPLVENIWDIRYEYDLFVRYKD